MDEVNQIRLENLLKIDQAILDSQSIESIADIALEELVKLFPNSWVSIANYQKPGDIFQVLAVDSKNKYPEWKPGEIVQVTTHPNLAVLQEGSILEVDDLSKFELGCPPKKVLLEENIQSCLILPLIAEKKLIGVVYVGKRNTNGFDDQEHEMLMGISNQLAISFHKAKLNDLNNQQREELSTLLEISTALAGSIVLDEVMQLAIDRATNVLGLDTGALYLLEGSELFLGATTPPLQPDFPHEYRIALLEHHPHIQKSINSGETVYLQDTSAAELTPQERGVMSERSLRSLLFVPLPVGTRIIGVLIMGTMGRTYAFSQNEIDLCRTFSVQMALAVENARLHHRAQQHALELEEMVRNRTAELEALTHAISHDLRAPLRAIKGFGQMLDQDLGEQLTSEGKDLLARMINASTRLEGMMEGLLSLARVDKRNVTVEQLDLSVLAEKILYELVSAEPDREIQYIVNDCGPFCKAFVGDKVYVEILLTNLFSNAIKFTEEQKNARIEFGCYRDGAKGIYYVKDNGLGINPKYIEEIFLPFRRLHRANEYSGYGIGMTIVKKIIDLYNGEIWIESELEEGTTVYFSLGKIK